jgi:hypothetical protein
MKSFLFAAFALALGVFAFGAGQPAQAATIAPSAAQLDTAKATIADQVRRRHYRHRHHSRYWSRYFNRHHRHHYRRHYRHHRYYRHHHRRHY